MNIGRRFTDGIKLSLGAIVPRFAYTTGLRTTVKDIIVGSGGQAVRIKVIMDGASITKRGKYSGKLGLEINGKLMLDDSIHQETARRMLLSSVKEVSIKSGASVRQTLKTLFKARVNIPTDELKQNVSGLTVFNVKHESDEPVQAGDLQGAIFKSYNSSSAWSMAISAGLLVPNMICQLLARTPTLSAFYDQGGKILTPLLVIAFVAAASRFPLVGLMESRTGYINREISASGQENGNSATLNLI